MKRSIINRYIILSAVALILGSCSATRDIPAGNYLLDDVKVVVDGKYRDINTSQLKNYVRQKGNSRWFSAVKLPLGVYALAGRDSSWLNRTLRQMGEAPVIYDTLQAEMTCRDLQQALQNKGYLDAQVELFVDCKKKKIDAVYVLHPGKPYYVCDLDFEIEDTAVARTLKKRQSILHQGMQFNVEALQQERNQITQWLQNSGYYRFHKEFITYAASKDETQHGVNLKLQLTQQHKTYTISQINCEGVDDDGQMHLRQKVLDENTFIEAGGLYSAADLQNTYNHFGRLGAVRYTNIAFEQHPDTTLLDAKIQIITNKPSTISFQPEGTNTAGDFGAAASLTYQNRNLFRGSETFSLQLRGAYEAIKGLEGYSNQNFTEYSVESRLSFPRFIMPFLSRDFRRRTLATSDVSLIYDTQDRPEFHRRVLTAGWSYQWRPQNHHDSYRFDLVNLNYVFMPWISDTFKKEYLDNESNQNVILRYNYEDLFIMRMGFGYSYNNGHVALRTNVETAGNLLGVCSKLFGGAKNDLGQYKLFNIAYAQYVKGDFDYTQELMKGVKDQLVFHIGLGLAYPYGNSQVLPFEKRYFSGGANSVRGWTVRSLGPGRYKDKDGRINFITQTGDIKLDLNVEYRSHLFWKFNGAAFVDAGNIWTFREYEGQEGGQFKFSRLLNDMAVSYGLGLRLNFDYFILRFDLGMKAVNPAYEIDSDAHYPLIHPKLSRDLAFHFAVGMPF
ncbi:BamA/TamA family outer membrane protein [Xylanibacter ruminicola]|uniref:Outer membrane protein assembly factor BamA n=1 Tax=Xylanibacter ruminicola TaxID=839 RepID=A0A1M6W3E9_XYLRU|nr:BamA/TamA family outer membrane protein [Xylanibacter ruminicola]SHK88261.1 Outer membrane protein assembly factor BamA [Xylanibacter ruminicola]